MEITFAQRYTFKTLMLFSLILGLAFLYSDHVVFISAAMEYGKMNVPNICYMILRIVGSIFIPTVFIVPSLFEFGRIKLARIGFIIYGVCHILAISWIFYFLAANPFDNLFNKEIVTKFLTEGGFVYTIAFWDTYGLSSVLFSIIYGIAAIYTGLNFDNEKSTAKAYVCSLFTLRIAFPLLVNIFTQGRMFSLFWITNNALALASQILFTTGIILAEKNNYTWIEFVWDQIAVPENEDQENAISQNSPQE